ncbi:MAG TPA: flagellar export protein FliJ [Caulobacteraceae bacterium]|jgi:flagellar FliJ protein|nr:flagellar export protein FliJ [Caulobacteraceae bacterium]
MSWKDSLIRISSYEVETLQKRLAEVVERRAGAELRLVILAAEAEAEIVHADQDAQAGWYRAGFLQAMRQRRASLQSEIAVLKAEEAGARDALAEAFEALKRFEHVAETARLAALKEEGRRETIALDELGLRRAR